MAEVLSQSQIDALLSTINGDDASTEEIRNNQGGKQYRKYDFYSPKKFTKDKLKIVKSIYDNYARIVASQINSLFRTSSEIEIIAVEEQRYYEFSNALMDNDVITVVHAEIPEQTKTTSILMHASPMLMLSMVDRMLGGAGNDTSINPSYAYTSIELALYQRVIRYIISGLDDAWSNYLGVEFEFQRLETSPSMFQEIGMDEIVVIVVLDVAMNQMTGKINICIPGNLLVSIFQAIDKQKHVDRGDREESENTKEIIMGSLSNTPMEVSAKLGKVELNLEDIYRLHEGDIIDLRQPKDAPVSLYVEGQPWFTGKMGVHKRNVAVKLEDRVDDETFVS